MRINGFRCDVCCKEHLLDLGFDPLKNIMHLVPDGWFTVFVGKVREYADINPVLCCSLGCLMQWAEKQIIPDHIVKQGTEEQETLEKSHSYEEWDL